MAKTVRTMVGALGVLLLVAAGCSDGGGEDRDDAVTADESGDDASDDAGSGAEDDGGSSGTIAASEVEPPDGSDPELRQEYIDALVEASGDPADSGFDAAQVECLATAYVDAAGTEVLAAAVTPDELRESPDASPAELGIEFPEGAGDVFYEQVSQCTDLRAALLDGLSEGDAEVDECLDAAVDDELIKDYMVAVLITDVEEDDPERVELEERMTEAIEPCMATD